MVVLLSLLLTTAVLEFEDGFYRSSPGLIQILVEMIMSRTRERCDDLATRGFMVILPDYFRGVVPEECGPGDFACWQGRLGTPNMGVLVISCKQSQLSFSPF